MPAVLRDLDSDLNSVLAKTHAMLAAFGSGPMTLRLSELSTRSGVPKTSAYRLAEQLVGLGMLERCADGYQLGLAMFELGNRVPVPASLRASARPVMVELCGATKATIHLSILDDVDVLYVEKIGGRGCVDGHSVVGGRLPLATTASGRVLMADHPDRATLLERLDERGVLSASPQHVGAALEQVRLRRFGSERQEIALGMKSLAVAVTDASDVTVAALSATVPVRHPDERGLLQHLWAAAGGISRAMASTPVRRTGRAVPGLPALAG